MNTEDVRQKPVQIQIEENILPNLSNLYSVVGLVYKIAGDAETNSQSSDLRSIGRMRLQVLLGSLLLMVASATIAAEASNTPSQDWMRNYFDSLALRRVGKRLLWGKRSLRKPDQGKESTEIWT